MGPDRAAPRRQPAGRAQEVRERPRAASAAEGLIRFERFTREARQTVVQAQAEAAALHHPRIGTEHLLLGLVGLATPTSAALARHGLTRDAVSESVTVLVDELDAEALTTLGIDLDAVRERVKSAFGPGALEDPARRRGATATGHVPFDSRAKKVLELSLRERWP